MRECWDQAKEVWEAMGYVPREWRELNNFLKNYLEIPK
jgi:hypothetical protein